MTNRLLGVLLPWLSCAAIAQAPTTTTAVPLPGAAPGWTAQTIHQADAGVWYAHVAKVVPDYVCLGKRTLQDNGSWLSALTRL